MRKRTVAEAVPEHMRDEYVALAARKDAITREIEALTAEREQVVVVEDLLMNMAADAADTDEALVSLRQTPRAGARLDQVIRALHPSLDGWDDWIDHREELLPGPVVSMNSLDEVSGIEPESLAGALVEFAERFGPEDHLYEMCVRIATADRDGFGLRVWHSIDGAAARLVHGFAAPHARPLATGTLVEVISRAKMIASDAACDNADEDY